MAEARGLEKDEMKVTEKVSEMVLQMALLWVHLKVSGKVLV